MTVELTWGALGASCAVAGLAGKIVHGLFSAALLTRDEKIKEIREDLARKKTDHDADVAALKATQKILFDKLDALSADLQRYKLHVAETYVNQAALEKLLVPIERRLETIEKDLRKGSN